VSKGKSCIGRRPANPGRRRFLSGTATAAVALAMPSILRAADRELVYSTWGGSWETAIREAWFVPFEKETGIKVTTASGNTYGRIQAMVEAGSTEWDVVEVLPDFQWLGAERGLLEPIDFSVIDRSAIMDAPGLVTDYSVPQVLFGRVMVYNTQAFDETPTSWSDFWDLERFPGMRTFQSRATGGIMEAALLADGVAPDKLYPLDIERALAKMDEIRDNILFYETNAQGEQYLSDGQAVLGLIPDGRALNIKDNGAPVEIQYDASLMTWSAMVVPKGAPNKDAAMQFLAYALTPEAQAAVAMAYTYGPVVPQAFDLIPEERARILSGGPQMRDQAILMDEAWWGENVEIATELLTAWMLG
jgi:putative spermidine/putrescine transport system substrate-binding protein